MSTPAHSPASEIVYVSRRESHFRLMTLVFFALGLAVFLVGSQLQPRRELPLWMEGLPWLPLSVLILVSGGWWVLKWHDRCVLRVERTAEGQWIITTLLFWGLRTRVLGADAVLSFTKGESGDSKSSRTLLLCPDCKLSGKYQVD